MRWGCRPCPKWGFVILPQALRLSIAPLVNYFSEFLKNTTLLSAIGVADLSLQAYLLGGQTYRYIEFLSAIAVVYFFMIFPVILFRAPARKPARPAGQTRAHLRHLSGEAATLTEIRITPGQPMTTTDGGKTGHESLTEKNGANARRSSRLWSLSPWHPPRPIS